MAERVLLVEDDELLGVLFELALCDAGYTVSRVRSGREALSKLDASPRVDLVVTDIDLGAGPNGWEVGRRARARAPDVPVIYMTGGRPDGWRPPYVPLGVLLLKPFTLAQLVELAGYLLAVAAEAGATGPVPAKARRIASGK